jgi:primosomal protein N''
MAKQQLEEYSLNVTPRQLKKQIKQQWLDDIDFLPDKLISQYKSDFVEMALANSFVNLFEQ